MHVILGFLGTIVTILWLLHRLAEMGIDLAGLNPFLWKRRRDWRKKYDGSPILKIKSPLEATALLIVATAKADGDMSSEEKQEILSLFQSEFQMTEQEAIELMISSSHLLGNGDEVRNKLPAVLAPSIDNFTSAQAASAIALIKRISSLGTSASKLQVDLIAEATALLTPLSSPKGKWD